MGVKPTPIAFQFTEEMKGFVTFGETNFEDGFRDGKESGDALMYHLVIRTEDTAEFVKNPKHESGATGYIKCDRLGGKRLVEKGVFNLLTDSADLDRKIMAYRLFFSDADGQPLTLSGKKRVQDNPGANPYKDTTTLYTNIFNGHISEEEEPASEIVAAGIIRILTLDLMKQMTTFRAYGGTFAERAKAFEEYGSFFLEKVWDVYKPSLAPGTDSYEREIPLYTTEGVQDAEISTHTFSTMDKLGLSMLRFNRKPTKDVVLLLHGLTTSSDMYIMPEHYNLVQYLLDNGYSDVWTLDNRMSNRHSYNLKRNRFNMDDVALYDYPPALATIRSEVGEDCRIHVICHCLGSMTFMMSLFGKAVDGIASVICNSVALTPRVPKWSKTKLQIGPFLADYVLGIEYLNPNWRREPGISIGNIFSRLISLFHKECNVPECHMLSFMWGSGNPAVYRHENMLDVTHRRAGDLFGGVSVNYFRHLIKMVKSDNTVVKYLDNNPKYATLPDDYFEHAKEIDTPIFFVTGEINDVFTDSNMECHKRLDAVSPGQYDIHVYPHYGHQDVFMGSNCHQETFPRMLEFLSKHSEVPFTFRGYNVDEDKRAARTHGA